MKYRHGFTLIEIAAVIVILMLLIGISLPMLNKGSSHHEAKLIAHSVQSLMSQISSMAVASGNVYILDTDSNLGGSTIPDHSGANRIQFSIIRIYSAQWDFTNDEVAFSLVDESMDIPVSLVATVNDPAGGKDHVYFKPDGQISSDISEFIIWPQANNRLFYQVDFDPISGNTSVISFKD